jgi:hypothetical protein
MKTQVSNFGLHSTGGLSFLLQGSGEVQTAEPWGHGNPFEVTGKVCPHAIDLSLEPSPEDWAEFQVFATDPLVREMLPLPKQIASPGYFGVPLEEEDAVVDWAIELEKLSSIVTKPGGRAMWLVNIADVSKELAVTNLGTTLLTWVRPQNTAALIPLGTIRSPRRLTLIGSSAVAVPPMFRRLRTSLANREVPDLDWGSIGARILREHMLGHSPYTTP